MSRRKVPYIKVKYLGQITDDGSRPAYRCTYE